MIEFLKLKSLDRNRMVEIELFAIKQQGQLNFCCNLCKGVANGHFFTKIKAGNGCKAFKASGFD